MKIRIDKDIQEAVADEFCDRLDKGENLFDLVGGWVVPEMEKRQRERNAKISTEQPETKK